MRFPAVLLARLARTTTRTVHSSTLGSTLPRPFAAVAATLLVCSHRRQSPADVPQLRAGFHADCRSWAPREPKWCRIVYVIQAPPPGTPSDARHVRSSLIGKPRRFECYPERADWRSGHCAMSHTRHSLLHFQLWPTDRLCVCLFICLLE